MLAFVLICVAASAAFVLLFLIEVAPGRNPLMAQRLSELARQLEFGEGTDAAVAELQPVYRGSLDELQRLARTSTL